MLSSSHSRRPTRPSASSDFSSPSSPTPTIELATNATSPPSQFANLNSPLCPLHSSPPSSVSSPPSFSNPRPSMATLPDCEERRRSSSRSRIDFDRLIWYSPIESEFERVEGALMRSILWMTIKSEGGVVDGGREVKRWRTRWRCLVVLL